MRIILTAHYGHMGGLALFTEELKLSLLSDLMTRSVRTYLTGRKSKFIFEPSAGPESQLIDKINLYIHIPFCKNACPYCPYNKIEYDEKLAAPYLKAVLNEIRLYRSLFGAFEVSSIYIGGGTPALLIDELKVIIEEIGKTFILKGNVCIEISPNDITDNLADKLKDCKVGLVSIGTQSFQDENLCFIGRNYTASLLREKIASIIGANFQSVNLDMMFALPGQGMKNLEYDLQQAVDCGVNQITTYPLFTFPYSTIGHYLRLKKVRMPDLERRRKMYYFINSFLLQRGFNRVSVWGFKKGNVPRYSSVTRDNYIGIGAGAGSHLPGGFYLNTFSVKEYIHRCSSQVLPTALYMKFTEEMQNYFWLYWRFYDTKIPKKELWERFKATRGDFIKVTRLLKLFKIFKLIEEDADAVNLNLRGAFWIHLLQNYYSLNYINKVWAVAMHNPYPSKISL